MCRAVITVHQTALATDAYKDIVAGILRHSAASHRRKQLGADLAAVNLSGKGGTVFQRRSSIGLRYRGYQSRSFGSQYRSVNISVVINIGDGISLKPHSSFRISVISSAGGAFHRSDLAEGNHQAAHTGVHFLRVVLGRLESDLISTQLDLTGPLLQHVRRHAASGLFPDR